MSHDRIAAPVVSEDGYLRLTFRCFCLLPFVSRRSLIDSDLRDDLRAEDVPAVHAGFCEWVDVSTPTPVSVAWAWFRAEEDGPLMIAPGGVSTNVMLVADGRDLGVAKSNELLRAWLSQLAWQRDVQMAQRPSALASRYALN